jgi:hypothetical protein
MQQWPACPIISVARLQVRVEARPSSGVGVVAQRALTCGEIVTVAPIFVSGATVDETLRAIVRAQLADGQSGADAESQLRLCLEFCPDAEESAGHSFRDDAGGYEAILTDLAHDAASRSILAARGIGSARELRLLGLKLSRNGFAEGVFPAACRFNHSCRPNSLFYTRAAAQGGARELVVMAASDIAVGDELTISYLPEARWHLPTDQRRLILAQQYDFHCACARCHRPSQTPAVRAAERASEAMCCAVCVTSGAARAGRHSCVDEHEDPSGSRQGGYTDCAVCGAAANEPELDSALVHCHARVSVAARAGASGLATAALEEYSQLRNLYEAEVRTMLAPTHWLVCEIHWRMQALSARLLSDGEADLDRAQLVRDCAIHSLALLSCMEPLAPAHSHVMAALSSRAADALDTMLDPANGAVGEWEYDPAVLSSSVAVQRQRACELREAAALVFARVGC